MKKLIDLGSVSTETKATYLNGRVLDGMTDPITSQPLYVYQN